MLPDELRALITDSEAWHGYVERARAENSLRDEEFEAERKRLALTRERLEMWIEFALIAIVLAIVIYLLLVGQITAAVAILGTSFSGAVIALFRRSR